MGKTTQTTRGMVEVRSDKEIHPSTTNASTADMDNTQTHTNNTRISSQRAMMYQETLHVGQLAKHRMAQTTRSDMAANKV